MTDQFLQQLEDDLASAFTDAFEATGWTGTFKAKLGDGEGTIIVPPGESKFPGALWVYRTLNSGRKDRIQVANTYAGIPFSNDWPEVDVVVGYPPGERQILEIMKVHRQGLYQNKGMLPSQVQAAISENLSPERWYPLQLVAGSALILGITGGWLQSGITLVYLPALSGILEMSSHRPSTTNMARYCLVYYDPETQTYGAVDGDDFDNVIQDEPESLMPATVPAGAMALGHVRVHEGQTAWNRSDIVRMSLPFFTPPAVVPAELGGTGFDTSTIQGFVFYNEGTAYEVHCVGGQINPPTVDDDETATPHPFGPLSIWITTVSAGASENAVYMCVNATTGAAVWLRLDGSGGGGGASELDDLTDVVITSPAAGQVLKFNGTNWVNDTDETGSSGSGELTVTSEELQISKVLFETTLSSAASTVDFDNIPQTYDHLKVIAYVRTSNSTTDNVTYPYLSINGIANQWEIETHTATPYDHNRYQGNNDVPSGLLGVSTNGASNSFGWNEIDIPFYRKGVAKGVRSRSWTKDQNADIWQFENAAIWHSGTPTSAVTRVTLHAPSGYNFEAGTTVQVIGIGTVEVVTNVEGALVTGSVDASETTYTPSVAADWTSSTDPGDVDNALDQLASRVTDLEGSSGDASTITYTPATVGDWSGSADPGNVNDALDQLADRVDALEDAPALTVTKKEIQTKTLLFESTLGTATTQITYDSIPSTYDHLYVELLVRGDGGDNTDRVEIKFNNDTTSANYRCLIASLDDSVYAPYSGDFGRFATIADGASPTNNWSYLFCEIPDYANTTRHKVAYSRGGYRRDTSETETYLSVVAWENTAAITRVDSQALGANMVVGSRMRVWGIREEEVVTDVTGTAVTGTHSTANVSSPPTDAELDAAFGTPASVGSGFVATLDDAGTGTTMYLVASDGTNWWHSAMTKAT